MKFLIAFIISFFALTKAGFSQYQKEQGYIAVEGQQYLSLERQIELLNETAIEDQWRVYLSLSMGCYVVSEMVLQMDGFSEEYWKKVRFNSIQGVVEVFQEVGVAEERSEEAFDHFAKLQENIYKTAQRSDDFSKFFVDEMGFCSNFFGKAWGK